jgi:two-component system alkaline phosphatase synthesis response regulator PhoP
MGKKILVADDEAHILHVVSMKLRNAGYEVATAVDGEEALALCRSERPDLLITDNQMPFLSGMAMCKALRAGAAAHHAPAIMLTARGFDIQPEEMAEAGIAMVLAKPFSPRELLKHVEALLGRPQAAATQPRHDHRFDDNA